ncbi:MAG: sigma-70 family RNA polymerase sigma factor [Planctomycetaceae bacterium]|nr:sigma-70 family RNA polymerase sigma factor [Planctomycetaceae bacterium]
MESPPIVDEPVTTGVSDLTLEALFASEETPLLHYAFSLVGRRAVAEEIVQEVFLQLHVHWEDVASPKAWLKRCVRNRAYTYLRDHKRELLKESDQESLAPVPESEPPETALIRLEAIAAVRQFLEKLDERDRNLLKLKYSDDLKYRDISTQTGLNIGNVGYRLHHILKELAAKLRKLGFDDKS